MNDAVECQLTASFLDSGRTIAHAGNAAAVVAGIGCMTGGPFAGHLVLALSLVFWFVGCWFAVRVSIDSSLFRALAGDAEEASRQLDRMLRRPGRPLAERTRGALALWRKQIAALALQLAALAVGIALRIANI